MLTSPLMQRALLAAVLVGAAAPVVGTFLVQRRMALMGDGIGHVALTGVALGWLVGSWAGLVPQDALAVPGAVVAAVVGSVVIELVRERGRTSGDLALALMFYGGIAGGVLLIKVAGGTNANLISYLFGSISTVSTSDLWWTVALAALVLGVGLGLRTALFAVSHDEEFARASGMPVRLLSMLVATIAALTVTIAMRVVGLLLVSALMIVPVAIAQLYARSFGRTMTLASVIGVVVSVVGLGLTYWQDIPPGATIVVLAIVVYTVAATLRPALQRRRPDDDPHPDMVDDVLIVDDVCDDPVPTAPAPAGAAHAIAATPSRAGRTGGAPRPTPGTDDPAGGAPAT
ncbi:metal ABC transporter permease [Cellulomonas algicola]|nr:metal ABC transporter permease [Cellulomonas algicola]